MNALERAMVENVFFLNYAVEIVLKVANKNVMRYAVVTYAKAVLGLKTNLF
jgi:hypothetical protein